MADREKVITHFRDAIEASRKENQWRVVRVDILEEAIELLKEQESVKPLPPYAGNIPYNHCGACSMLLENDYYRYCPWCGRKVNWNG